MKSLLQTYKLNLEKFLNNRGYSQKYKKEKRNITKQKRKPFRDQPT